MFESVLQNLTEFPPKSVDKIRKESSDSVWARWWSVPHTNKYIYNAGDELWRCKEAFWNLSPSCFLKWFTQFPFYCPKLCENIVFCPHYRISYRSPEPNVCDTAAAISRVTAKTIGRWEAEQERGRKAWRSAAAKKTGHGYNLGNGCLIIIELMCTFIT